jgi:hypothetical protein
MLKSIWEKKKKNISREGTSTERALRPAGVAWQSQGKAERLGREVEGGGKQSHKRCSIPLVN